MPAAEQPILKLNKVVRRYDSSDNMSSLTILDNVSLEVNRAQSMAIVGPSGSGKSTLLQIIGTLDRPTSGEVFLNGQELGRLTLAQLAQVRNREIGFVFQAHYLLPQCSVLENVLVPTLVCSDQDVRNTAPKRAERLLERVGLGRRMEHRPGQLSGGERQRVAVVRALINQPQVLLADEPTGSLDHASAHQLGQLLEELNREEHVTLIVVTHAKELAQRMNQVLELKDGRLLAQANGS